MHDDSQCPDSQHPDSLGSANARKGTEKDDPSVVIEHLLDRGDSKTQSPTYFGTVEKAGALRRVGWWGLTALLIGTLCILAALAFLCFLWMSNGSNPKWQRIVLAGWITRSVTIAALVIRISVAQQATICTSMLAALLLQRSGTRLPLIMPISIARAQNTGAHSLAWLMLPMREVTRDWILSVAVAILVLTTSFSQFTSTVLLTGIRLSAIPNFNESITTLYGVSSVYSSVLKTSSLYWQSKPALYPAIAEYTEPPIETEGVHDTGLSMRGLLPISSTNQREMMKSYNGRASVMDSRVVCAQPRLKDLSFAGSNFFINGREAPVIFGLVGTDKQAPGFGVWCNESCRADKVTMANLTQGISATFGLPVLTKPEEALYPFRCPSAISTNPLYAISHDVPVAVCTVGSWNGLLSPLWPFSSFDTSPSTVNVETKYEYITGGLAYLIIRTTGDYGAWDYLGNNADYADLKLRPSFADGEWLTIPVETKLPNVSFQFSLCFTNFPTLDMDIHATRDSNKTEPTVGFSVKEGIYETTAVRRQLSAVPEKLSDASRGILRMEPQMDWSRPQGWVDIDAMSNAEFAQGNYTDPGMLGALTNPITPSHSLGVHNISIIMCQTCDSGDYGQPEPTWATAIAVVAPNYIYPHPVYAKIFNDVIRDTNHPALALQAHFTNLYRSAYYDVIDQFNISDYATVVSFVQVLKPMNMSVLLAVIAPLCIHLILVACITRLFICRGTLSLLGNVWSAVGQVYNQEVGSWCEIAGEKSDREIERLMGEKGHRRTVLKLDKDATGRTLLRLGRDRC